VEVLLYIKVLDETLKFRKILGFVLEIKPNNPKGHFLPES